MSEQFGEQPLQGAPQPGLADQGEREEEQRDRQRSHNNGRITQSDLLSRSEVEWRAEADAGPRKAVAEEGQRCAWMRVRRGCDSYSAGTLDMPDFGSLWSCFDRCNLATEKRRTSPGECRR